MSNEPSQPSAKWIFLKLRPVLRLLNRFRGSAEDIAGGFSLGLFIAFTPTIGVQILIAVFLATFFKISRPAAIIGAMVTNPVTIPPLFTLNYFVGNIFLDGPTVSEVYKHFLNIASQMAKLNIWQVGEQIKAFSETGQEMLFPLLLGSVIVGVVAALLSYYILVRVLRFLISHRQRRKP